MTTETTPGKIIDGKKEGWGLYTEGSKKSVVRTFHLDDIDIVWEDNVRRCLWTYPSDGDPRYAGKPVCFTDDDVADLFESLPRDGQVQPVEVSVNPATRRMKLEEGYRRAFAVLRLRDKGIDLPGGHTLRCERVEPAGKVADGWKKASLRGAAMQALKPLSPVDVAFLAKKMVTPEGAGGHGMKEAEARQALATLCLHNPHFRTKEGTSEISESQFNCLLRLTTLPPERLRMIAPAGPVRWTDALKKASVDGVGNVRGPSGPQTPRGIKPSQAIACAESKAFADEIPGNVSRADLLAILRYVGDATTEIPQWARAAIEAQRDEQRVAKELGKRKAPPKQGKRKNQEAA